MKKLFDTTLLGMEFAAAIVPYQNINGSFYEENGSFSFWSNGNCIVAFPCENVQRWGSDYSCWTKDWAQKAVHLGVEAVTLGFFTTNRFAYNYIVYFDEDMGSEVEIWLLASNAWLNLREADRRQRLIGQHIADWRGNIRRKTLPR